MKQRPASADVECRLIARETQMRTESYMLESAGGGWTLTLAFWFQRMVGLGLGLGLGLGAI